MSNLYILAPHEQQAFDYPPILPVETRAICFAMDNELEKEIGRLRTATNKVGFLLQYGYFKACKRFFIMSRFRQEDVEYVARLLGVLMEDIDLSCYKKKMPSEHQKKILVLFDCKQFDDEAYAWLQKEATNHAERQIELKQIFIHLLNLLIQNKFEIPSYHRLAELITLVYSEFERRLLAKINKKLRKNDKKLLDALLNEDDSNYSTLLNQLKTINQSTKPKAIQASLTLFETIKDYFLKLKPIIDSLNLSSDGSAYYATWMQKAKLSQLKQFPEKDKLYLHMLAFIQHQFHIRQDYLVDVLLKCVQSVKNTAIKNLKEVDELSRTERRNALRHLTKSNSHYRNLVDEIAKITKIPVLSDSGKIKKIDALLSEHTKQKNVKEQQKIDLFVKSLDRLEKNKDYFDILEKLSVNLTYFDDVKLRQRIEKQLNRIELSNKFSNAVFFANDSEFKQGTREEQEIATACKVLIQNAVVLWNYLYLSQMLANCINDNERNDMVSMIKSGSMMTWRHINLHGKYDFSRQSVNDYPFDMAKILSLQVA